MKKQRIYVARWVDASNINAQVLSARAMLLRFDAPGVEWIAPHYHEADSRVISRENVVLVRSWRGRLNYLHLVWNYQRSINAIFYSGGRAFDRWGLRIRRLTGRRVPIISTLEGLAGGEDRAKEYSKWAGHPVYCQRVPPKVLQNLDRLYRESDHVIAISPFLAEMGRRRYGDKFSSIPLGINDAIYHAPDVRPQNVRLKVIGAGSLQERKRPSMFFDLAARHPDADFVWYGGEGTTALAGFRSRIASDRLKNLSFPGNLQPKGLGDAFRGADLFLMPSLAEGVPQVIQGAAACGLPVVCFGYYQAPCVEDGKNGRVVWNDNEFYEATSDLLGNAALRAQMGECGIEMGKEWSWDGLAPQWERQILRVIESRHK